MASAKYRKHSIEYASRKPFSSAAFNPVLPVGNEAGPQFKAFFPDAFTSLIAKAQSIRTHRFDFLGRTIQHGREINWHLDPASMKEWQKKSYDEIALQYEGSPADAKHVWELNRHQYFVTLGQAYCISGDRTYLDELVAQWLSWIKDNPYGIGINWASPLEIGVRLISWTLAFQFIEGHLSQQDREAIAKSVWQQLSYLASHLSSDKIVRTNHLIGEAAGLYITACSFSFHESGKWTNRGKEILSREILSQTFEDGVSKEESSSYHRFDIDFFLLSFIKSKESSHLFTFRYAERLQKMIRYLLILQSPDSSLPVYGDCDNGRGFLLAPSLNFWDSRGLIAAGGIILQNKDLANASLFNEESFWLLNESERNILKHGQPDTSVESCFILADSRHVIIADREAGDYCFFRAGEFGLGGRGFSSHSHNDLFSPIIFLKGNSILTDTGNSVYLGNDMERDYLRSAAAHNTTFSASWDFFESKRWFGWKKCLDGIILSSTRTEKEFRVRCAFKSPSLDYYTRTIVYQSGRHVFTVEDLFTRNVADIQTYFHLDHGVTATVDGSSLLFRRSGAVIARCVYSGRLNLKVEEGWVSKSYGSKEPSLMLHFKWNAIALQPEVFTFETVDQ